MKEIPSYSKILTLGSAYTENALVGHVVIQEKIDGSFYGFGLNEDGELTIRSKGQILIPDAPPKMFEEAVNYVLSIKERLQTMRPDTYFYSEYLQRPKHNVLKYERTPTNHLVLFDAVVEGRYADRVQLANGAELLGIDIIPELFRGEASIDTIKECLSAPSYLGGETVEGVVVKNYDQTIALGSMVYPLFTKYVREAFKERHNAEWKVKSPKGALSDYVEGFRSEARWQKAVQYLRDQGQLECQPKDIGALIKRVQADIEEEEAENIKTELYKKFIADIKRKAVAGLPEWYKTELLERLA